MVVVYDITRHSVLYRLRNRGRYIRTKRKVVITAHQRHLRIPSAQTDPSSQATKSAGNWPESISTFFHGPRQTESVSTPEIVVVSGDGNSNPPRNGPELGGDDDGSESENLDSAELLNLAEVYLILWFFFKNEI